MNSLTLSEISQVIYPVCYSVEEKIAGQQDKDLCDWWAKKNAFRHSLSLRSILTYLHGNPSIRKLKILNLSGLYPGHQDFSICHYLKDKLPVEFFAVDHPNSPFLKNSFFVAEVEKLRIRTILRDVKQLMSQEIGEYLSGPPDIVLFTEIAEHLEHGTFLRSLQLIAEILPPHGLVLFSTPNADAMKYRIGHLMGRELGYWGDGATNMGKGLFGHVVYYNIPRLRRLLHDAGLKLQQEMTVNFPVVDPKFTGTKKRKEQLKLSVSNALIDVGDKFWRMPTLKYALKTVGDLIYLEIRKGSRERIPLAL